MEKRYIIPHSLSLQCTLKCFYVTSGNTKANKRKTKMEDLKKNQYTSKLNTCEFCQNKPWKELGVRTKVNTQVPTVLPSNSFTLNIALPRCSL